MSLRWRPYHKFRVSKHYPYETKVRIMRVGSGYNSISTSYRDFWHQDDERKRAIEHVRILCQQSNISAIWHGSPSLMVSQQDLYAGKFFGHKFIKQPGRYIDDRFLTMRFRNKTEASYVAVLLKLENE